MPAEGGRKRIFISHAASDSDWPELAVEAVAEKLRDQGAHVLLDFWHERSLNQKLPLAEWRQWMRECLDQADHVLCLCSTRYSTLAHRENQAEPAGRGVAFEAFEIEKRLYQQKQHNRNWVWILKLDMDSSPKAVVPKFLEERCPEYGAPSEEARLVQDLVGKSAARTNGQEESNTRPNDLGEGEAAAVEPLQDQRQWVEEKLRQSPAIWAALCNDAWEGRKPAALRNEGAFAAWLSSATPEEAEDAMFAVRRALGTLPAAEDLRRPAEIATASVYALAACRLVDRAAVNSAARFPTQVSHAAHLYCAVIATVLFGGRLEFAPSDQPGLPRAPNAYDIRVPAAGDYRNQAFENAVYHALFATDRRMAEVVLDAAELTEAQRAQIRRRIQTVRRRQQQTLTLVVHADAMYPPADEFAKAYTVPVFVCDREIAGALIGMTAADLIADIQEMWRELTYCSCQASAANAAQQT